MEEKPLRKCNHHTLPVIKGLCGSHGWATAYANLRKYLLNKKIKQKAPWQCLLCLTGPDCYRKRGLSFRSIQANCRIQATGEKEENVIFCLQTMTKKQAQKISSVMDQDLHDCVLSRQSRVATLLLSKLSNEDFSRASEGKNCNLKFGPQYIFLNRGSVGEKSINTYTKFTIIKFTSIISTMNIQRKWTMLQNSLGYIFYQWMVLFTFFKKIRSGRLHGATLIHLIFFCLFPTKHFHRGKTMMSSSSSLCWDCVVARFSADLWIRKFQWYC